MRDLPPIEEEFVSTGEAKVQMRVISILGRESDLSAQAAECANDQGRFWEYHDTLYANQVRERNSGGFSDENLKRFAEALELDTTAFDFCLDSGKYASRVRDDTEAARQIGVTGTPRIFVNGEQAPGTGEELRSAIRESLASGS